MSRFCSAVSLKKISFRISAVSRSVFTIQVHHSHWNEFCSYPEFYQTRKVLLYSKRDYYRWQIFHLSFYNIFFLSFLKERNKCFLVLYKVFWFCRELLRDLVPVIIAFDSSLSKKDIRLPHTCFILHGACLYIYSITIYIAVVWFTCFLCVFQEVNFWQIHGGKFVYAKFVRISKIFRTQVFAGFAVFWFCV